MSRRRGQFEHRTSIFEGAYRAWSHLGGYDPLDIIKTTGASGKDFLDPVDFPHDPLKDSRRSSGKADERPNGSTRFFPYEPLPRSGLGHPYNQAIIISWLGPDAEEGDMHHGLITLRTWWQHRRKGESASSKAALGTPKMIEVVNEYTRHFFNLAHCMVVNDNEQPPRTLCGKLKIAQRNNIKFGKRAREDAALQNAYNAIHKMDEASTRTKTAETSTDFSARSVIVTKIQGSVAHTGSTNMNNINNPPPYQPINEELGTTPIILKTHTSDIQIAMKIGGIASGHCVKMIETLLKDKAIPGLLNVVVDEKLSAGIVKIAQVSSAKRIAKEINSLLEMIGYSAEVKEIELDFVLQKMRARHVHIDFNLRQVNEMIVSAFETFVRPQPTIGTATSCSINWRSFCSCPDGEIRSGSNCPVHTQLNQSFLDAFDIRANEVIEILVSGMMDTRYKSTSHMIQNQSASLMERPTKQQKRQNGATHVLNSLEMNSTNTMLPTLQRGPDSSIINGHYFHDPSPVRGMTRPIMPYPIWQPGPSQHQYPGHESYQATHAGMRGVQYPSHCTQSMMNQQSSFHNTQVQHPMFPHQSNSMTTQKEDNAINNPFHHNYS